MLKPIARKSLSDAVFEQLRDQIITGAMKAGSALPSERVLCEMLGINRGALREALKRLEQARLVSVQHGGATKVRDFRQSAGLELLSVLLLKPDGGIDIAVARSIMEMRSALAPDIARLAALRAQESIREALTATVDRMENTEDLLTLQELAMEFWDLAVEGSGNIAYRLAFNALSETYRHFFALLTQVLQAELQDLDGYRAIAKAVLDRDTATAEKRAMELTRKGAQGVDAVLLALDEASQP